jgi:hypothetical protein
MIAPGSYPSMTAPGSPSASNGTSAAETGGGGGSGGGSAGSEAGAGGGSESAGAEAPASMLDAMPLWQKLLAIAAVGAGLYYGYRWYKGGSAKKSGEYKTNPYRVAKPRKGTKAFAKRKAAQRRAITKRAYQYMQIGEPVLMAQTLKRAAKRTKRSR